MKSLLTAALVFCSTAATADTLSFYDQQRLVNEPVLFSSAIQQALSSDDRQGVDVLLDALKGIPAQANAVGDWTCQNIQMGGQTDLVASAVDTCSVTQVNGSLMIEKTSGEQRFSGTLTDRNGTLLYAGVGFKGDAPTQSYEDFSEVVEASLDADATHPQIGILERMSDNRARLMLPDPVTGGDYAIVYLTR